MDSLSFKYKNGILLGDFTSCMEDSPMKTFCKIFKLRNLIKEPTCFKNTEDVVGLLENPICIELLLANKSLSLKNIYVIETGLSDVDKMVVGVSNETPDH